MISESLRQRIAAREAGLLTYGLTAPKQSTAEERRREIAARQAERIAGLGVDGLVIYDLQDESSRTDAQRPFPFMEGIDPVDYAYDYLGEVDLPKIVYRCVANADAETLDASLSRIDAAGGLTVLVGSPSREHRPPVSLADAMRLRSEQHADLPLGGVMIAERHDASADEHLRVVRKLERGASFLVSQAVYSVVATKDVLSDLAYHCADQDIPVPPVLITLSPCGSAQTLDFLRWLGVDIPRWLDNDLRHSRDILGQSVDACEDTFADLHAFAVRHGIPLGCNVESVSVRREEIEASVELVRRVKKILGR